MRIKPWRSDEMLRSTEDKGRIAQNSLLNDHEKFLLASYVIRTFE